MQRLASILNYHLSITAIIIFLFFLGPIAGAMFLPDILAMIASILFTPYMLHVLYNEKKYGWIMFFSIIVIFPTLLSFCLLNSALFQSLINYSILGFVYFYYFLLRLTINEWVNEDLAKKQRIYDTQNEKQVSDSFNEIIK